MICSLAPKAESSGSRKRRPATMMTAPVERRRMTAFCRTTAASSSRPWPRRMEKRVAPPIP
jgi:hypothetical protein